ncbi:acyl-CoA dehydrogenase family protein [Kibdelosporangium aridum]|uniref:Acyl-[acyl-carrier-protein] dehydrogenase MbtN n=1 Tax=Kibdelosporangium aridum TaxID=2030 RepID=A0A1Y5Y0D0_KIBAR|nr:acyl-CoA dehydrogenase [Kibdelosporangium aridum]SMD22986.1 citronellyl-CoA dehydrogenase [Kibdelosporangium aridum]
MSTAVAARSNTTGAQLWAMLGRSGSIAQIYQDGDPAAGVDPRRLGELLATVDETSTIGATLAVCVQLATAVPLLATGGETARQVLLRALDGDSLVALAATDEAAGSDLTALATEVRIEEAGIEVHGTKKWITNATCADEILVLARHRHGRHFANFTWILVPASAPGVQVESADTELFDGSGTGHIHFDHVRLPRDRLVGRVGRGLPAFATHIAVERLAGALWGVALCRRVLADTKQRLLARPHGGATLWQMDSVRQRFAVCLVRTRQLHALTCELMDRVAVRHDTTAAAMLKSSVADTLDHVLGECGHLQGAEGFSSTGAQKLRAQAALFGVGGGATEVVLSVVGDNADAVLEELSP